GPGRCAERHEECLGLRAEGGQVAEVDRGRLVPELAVGRPVEPEVDALEERVLGDHEVASETRGVVLDSPREAAALELGEEPELPELREPHRSPRTGPRRPWRRGSPR